MANIVITILAVLVHLAQRALAQWRWAQAFLTLAAVQPLLDCVQPLLAYAVLLRARRTCPGYRTFLDVYQVPQSRRAADFAQIPITNKTNYIHTYSLEARCTYGRLPQRGTVIDESSGSSGTPNNWVRGPTERAAVKRSLQINFELAFPHGPYILLNCFALGPWATGMNVSMSLVESGVLKSIGPDQTKLEHTLEVFGPTYRYIILGYPPFLKAWVDSTALDLSAYHLDAIVGGEGISEGLRSYLQPYFGTIRSSYGASDLEINMAAEHAWTVRLRELCAADASLSRALFGRDTPPMIFQYNPLDYYIETTDEGELVFTICRLWSAVPKVRYNLRDVGGTIPFRVLAAKLRKHGVPIETLASEYVHFPVLYVFGRNDMSVPFYGAKVTPNDVEQIISANAILVQAISSFQLSTSEDEQQNRYLILRLERTQRTDAPMLDATAVHATLFDGLVAVNQDFREVTRMFPRDHVVIELFDHGTGPFSGQDARIKRRYIA